MLDDARLFLKSIADETADASMAAEFEAAWRGPLEEAAAGPQALCLRDFYVGNLMWLPARDGLGRVGLLDFQDARSGPTATISSPCFRTRRRDLG